MMAPAPIMLASPSEVHSTAILGEVPGRAIPSLALRVGSHAVIRAHSVIYAGCQIGSHLETGHRVVIREEDRLGDHLSIWNNSTIDYGCIVGDRVRTQS